MSASAMTHLIPLTEQTVRDAARAGLMMQTADDAEYMGRHVQIRGRKLLNFGGCSYLGLEQRHELKDAAVRAIRRYGTQFSHSRGYLQSPLYEQLESALAVMTGGFPLVTPSTTLGHMAALPILVQSDDAILIDRWTHASVRTAAGLVPSVPVLSTPHNDIDRLSHKIARLSAKHSRVWLLLDGVYSMHGDFAPLSEIAKLLANYPSLHLYIDDAHSTSWFGECGRGWALDTLPDRSRAIVALSLNKAFSAGGGALIFPTQESRTKVRRCGGPMLFSGPVPPPMLGAAVASAELHLRSDFTQDQMLLGARIELVRALARELGVPFVSDARTPIFFVQCGYHGAIRLAQALRNRGAYVSPGGFPAVSKGQEGIRFTVSLCNTEADIRSFMKTLATERRKLDEVAPEATTST